MTGAALLAAVGDAGAAQLYWNTNAGTANGYNKVGNWLTGTNVSSGTAPTTADTVNISAGWAALAAPGVADTVNVSGTGRFDIGHNGVLNASTLNIRGGEFNSSSGGPPPVYKGPQGIANISTLVNVSGGLLDNYGVLNVLPGGTFQQSGGTVEQLFITTPSYTLSGGTIAGGGVDGHPMAPTIIATNFTQTGGAMGGYVTSTDYDQSGGTMTGTVHAGTYELSGAGDLSGGTIDGSGVVDFSTGFALDGTGVVDEGAQLVGAAGSTMSQAGGTMDGIVTGLTTYTQSGGSFAGSLVTQTYDLTDGSASSSGGTISASNEFLLEPTSGTATVGAALSGAGNLVKSGAGAAILTGTNTFAGTVSIMAGVLEVQGGAALPPTSAVSVADTAGAELLVTDSQTIGSLSGGGSNGGTVAIADGAVLTTGGSDDTGFNGTMTGMTGGLVKQGSGTFTLGGDVTLGGLSVDAGELAIGTGTSTNTASFESAEIGAGATVYIAKNATLIIRVPNDIVNNGQLINDGTVYDDLANVGTFINYDAYNANVTSNTGTIVNQIPGVWTGNVLSNDNTITNAHTANWLGDVVTNAGTIVNNGVWTGDIKGNTGYVQNATGNWVGRVLGNSAHINNYAGASWTGVIVGNGATGQIRSDAPWNGGIAGNTGEIFNYNVWTNGDITANAGSITNDGFPDGATWNGSVLANDGQIVNDNGATWNGAVEGNNNTIVNQTGSSWNGAVTGNGGGSNGLAQIHNDGTWTGAVEANSGDIFNAVGSWNGAVASNAGTITNAAGSAWTGNVLANSGTIDTAGTWNGDFSSAGTVDAQGAINGDVTNSGLLRLTGSLSGIGLLSNTGTLDMGRGAANTLGVASASLGPDSFYDVDINSSGFSDLLQVSGAAALAGTVRVTAISSGGPYDTSTRYTILTAGSVTGSFAGVSSDLAFLAPRLSQDDTDVYLMLKRNDVGFAYVGTTANEKAAAGSAEALGPGNPIYDSVLWLNDSQAQQAFDDLAGEGYGATESTFVQNAGLLTDMMTGHLDQAFDALHESDAPNAYAATPGAAAAVAPRMATAKSGVWGQLYGARGLIAANDETDAVTSSTGGFAIGLDGLAGDWRLGMMLHAGTTVTEMSAVGSSSRSTDYGAGAYAGRQWGETRLSLGADYTRHNVNSTRAVAFPGFTDNLSASYAANTAEAFGKLSQHFDLGVVSLTPYASLAYVRQATDGFTESGGPAALSSAASFVDATFTTLGVGVDRKFAVGDGMLLTAKGGLGWRHAIGTAPDDTHRLADGTSFSVIGAPIAGDTAVVSAGLNLDISADHTLDFSYDGQIGAGEQTHALKGTWAGSF